MTAKAESLTKANAGPPKRRFRNYLLDTRFQLKYTGMVVIVTVIVASVLGWFAWRFSREMTESLNATLVMQADIMDEQAIHELEDQAAAADRNTALAIIGGILALALALGFTGIIVTHRVVGPAYKIRLLLGDVAAGRLKVQGRLRKGDELQEVFDAFERMIESLRATQAEEIAQLDQAIEHARKSGTPEDALKAIVEVRDRMQKALD